MKINALPLFGIGMILGLILGSLIPFKFMAGLVIFWVVIGIGDSIYKNYLKKY